MLAHSLDFTLCATNNRPRVARAPRSRALELAERLRSLSGRALAQVAAKQTVDRALDVTRLEGRLAIIH